MPTFVHQPKDFWSGLMFGHMRVRTGLAGSILNHIASNALMLTVALLSLANVLG